ncbi:uncharacterized protein YhdP [Paraburkholderia youngii]
MSERNESADPQAPSQVRHVSGSDHIVLRRTLRVLATLALVLYFIAGGVFLGLRYVVLPRVDTFRPRIEAAVSDKLHTQFTIGRLAPHWSGFQPGLDVTNLVIRDHDGQPALTIPHATATVSWRSLWEFHPALSSLIVDQPDVLVSRSDDGVLSVAGVPVPTRHSGNDALSTWLLRQQAIVVRGGVLRWRDATRHEPELALRDIRIAILNDGRDHRMALQAPPDGSVLKGPLDFRTHFRHAPLSAIGKPINWSGQVYMSTGPVDLPTLARYVEFPIETFAGRIDNAIWIDFSEGRMNQATGQLNGNDVAMRVRPTQPKLLVPIAHFLWRVEADDGEYRLQLSDLRAELGQPPLEDGTPLTRILRFRTLDSRYRTASQQHGQLLSISGDRVDLGILAEFSRALPLPRHFLNELVRINPRGLVANYVIEVERDKPESGEVGSDHRPTGAEPIERYRFKGDLQGISFAAQEPGPGLTPRGHPRAGIPGIENLWGTVDADEKGGRANLDTSNVAITLPGVFDDPRLTLARLRGRAEWTMGKKSPGDTRPAFAVKLDDFSVSNPDVEASATASYSNPGHGRGSLDLKADFQRAQVTRIARYLPTAVSEKLRIYLDHGLQAGVSRGGTIEVHGDLTKFPYARDPDAGLFHIVAPFTGGKFDPTPFPPRNMRNGTPNVWPPLDGIDGVFELKQNVLHFDIDRGRYKRVALTGVNGHIDDLGTKGSNLTIQGNGRGPLADMLDYVNHSSLGIMARHQTEKIRAEGPASLALKLTIPRTPKPHVGVEGALGFLNNRLSVSNAPPLSRLNGRVRFTERTAEVERLSGQFLGGDVHANGGLRQDGTYALALNGHIAVDAARELHPPGAAAQVLTHMSGSAPYALRVAGARGRLPQVSANSDLSGLALDFPAPFEKQAGTPMPLHFAVNPSTVPGEAGLERADLTLGPVAAAYLLRYRPSAQPRTPPTVVRGAIGVNRAVELPSEGVVAAVDIKEFNADAWARARRAVARGRGRREWRERRRERRQYRNQRQQRDDPRRRAESDAHAVPAEPLRAAHRHADASQASLGQRDRRRVAHGPHVAGEHRVESGVRPRVVAAGRDPRIAGRTAGALRTRRDSIGRGQGPARPGDVGARAEHAVDRSGRERADRARPQRRPARGRRAQLRRERRAGVAARQARRDEPYRDAHRDRELAHLDRTAHLGRRSYAAPHRVRFQARHQGRRRDARALRSAENAQGRHRLYPGQGRVAGRPDHDRLFDAERQPRARSAPRPDPEGRSRRRNAARRAEPAKPRAHRHARFPRRARRGPAVLERDRYRADS